MLFFCKKNKIFHGKRQKILKKMKRSPWIFVFFGFSTFLFGKFFAGGGLFKGKANFAFFI